MSRASLFNYYNGKPAILEALAARLEPRLVQMVKHYQSKPMTTTQRITALFAYVAKVVDQTAELTRLLFIQGYSSATFPQLRRALVELVEQGQRQGDVRDDFSAETVADSVYLGFVAGLMGWAQSDGLDPVEQFSQRARFLCTNLQT